MSEISWIIVALASLEAVTPGVVEFCSEKALEREDHTISEQFQTDCKDMLACIPRQDDRDRLKIEVETALHRARLRKRWALAFMASIAPGALFLKAVLESALYWRAWSSGILLASGLLCGISAFALVLLGISLKIDPTQFKANIVTKGVWLPFRKRRSLLAERAVKLTTWAIYFSGFISLVHLSLDYALG